MGLDVTQDAANKNHSLGLGLGLVRGGTSFGGRGVWLVAIGLGGAIAGLSLGAGLHCHCGGRSLTRVEALKVG